MELPTRSPSRPLRASHAGNQIPCSSHISRPQDSCNGGYHLSNHSSCLAMGNAPNAGRDASAMWLGQGVRVPEHEKSFLSSWQTQLLGDRTHPESQCQCDRHKGPHTQRSIS